MRTGLCGQASDVDLAADVTFFSGSSGGVMASCSSGCSGQSWRGWWLARSATVSVTAQKAGGESTHPIGRERGRATSCSSFGYLGKATASLRMPVSATWRR